MKCPVCSMNTQVLESRQSGQKREVRRRRQCLGCPTRFTTYERIDAPALVVIKTDGRLEAFNRHKIVGGILRAIKNTKISKLDAENMADRIENDIFSLGKTEVKSSKIGDIVLSYLADADKIAYLRFASVYKKLKTIPSLEKEMSLLKNNKN